MEAKVSYYWAVQAKCGHVGRKHFIPVVFALRSFSDSARDAAEIARWLPRVKHRQKDAIMNVKPLSFEDYRNLKNQNNQDPFLHCKNVQELRCIYDLELRIESDERPDAEDACPEGKTQKLFYDHKTKIRNPKSYLRLNPDLEQLSWVAL